MDSADVKLLIDTGAGIGLLLHSNTHHGIQLPDQFIETQLGMGLGGDITGFLGRVEKLKMNDFTFSNVITGFQEVDTTSMAPHMVFRNGIIGNQILSRFTIIFDFAGSRMYLKPEKNFKDRFEYDKSGITVMAAGAHLSKFVVTHVISNSPADRAGIKTGDEIKSVNSIPTSLLTLNSITRRLRSKEGRTIRNANQARPSISNFEVQIEGVVLSYLDLLPRHQHSLYLIGISMASFEAS